MRVRLGFALPKHLLVLTVSSVLGLLLPSPAHATLTLNSIAGASYSETPTGTTKPKIYAGFAGECTPTSDSATCNSCTGTSSSGTLFPCNKNNVIPNTLLTITMQTTDTATSPSSAVITYKGVQFTPSITPTLSGNLLTVQIRWSQLCSEAASGDSVCNNSMSGDLAIKHGSDTLTFAIVTRSLRNTSATYASYTDCNSTSVSGDMGFCHFSLFPGDEKLYANDLVWAASYPASPASGVDYNAVVFFYEAQIGSDGGDIGTIARISNASPSVTLTVNAGSNPPIADDRISGLSNEQRYCVIMANQDITGIISYFTPVSTPAGEICGDPSKVVGLLDDKSCFIATAAFGSDMAPQVQSFREFRNQFLLTNSIGRSFVKFYYKHSPYYANLIAQSEVAKAIVRAALWPALVFAQLSVAYGFEMVLFVFVGLGLLVYFMVESFRQRRRVRGAA